MSLRFLVVIALVTLSVTEAATVGHDQVQPFAQLEPTSVSEKAAVHFKPSLSVFGGCHPYPAVNAAGETSGGLKPTGAAAGGCEGSELGSQIYGRAGSYKDLWAIMYTWYLPKNSPVLRKGYRHDWQHVVVWIDNPEASPPTMKAISVWDCYMKQYDIYYTSLEGYLNGSSAMVKYFAEIPRVMPFMLGLTMAPERKSDRREFQDLVMWEQLTDEARTALEDTDFGHVTVPFKNATFQSNLNGASPKYKLTRIGGRT